MRCNYLWIGEAMIPGLSPALLFQVAGAGVQVYSQVQAGKAAEAQAEREEEERKFYDERKAGTEWLEALAPLGTDASKPFLEHAPWLIAIFVQRRGGVKSGMSGKNYYIRESVGIATGFLIQALHNAGLVTLTHTPNPMNFLSEICERPSSDRPYILLVAGYPTKDATIPHHSTIKKPLSDIVSYL